MLKFSYKPLWKLLIDKDMNNSDLMEKTHICKSTFYKMKKNKNITTDVLLRICQELKCDISDIAECVEKQDNE